MARPQEATSWPARVTLALAFAVATLQTSDALAIGKRIVCTITVNSPDEKEAFRRNLPADKYEFVELVERGRADWLESARRKGIRCDALIISGHYDGGDYAGGNEFFSEHVDASEYLPVDEMERVACSEPDDGMFSRLKAVYLFGCNTLNPEPLHASPEEMARTLVQSGHLPADAARLARDLGARYADSSRDRMRHIFKGTPAIYGFSSVAPLGPAAATFIDRYFRAGGAQEMAGSGGAKLLGYFPGRSLTLTRGSTDADADAGFRRDICRFFDERLPATQKARFVHELLRRDMAEVRPFLDRLEHYVAVLDPAAREAPDVAAELDAIARDEAARERYLAFMRNADAPRMRARLIALAGGLDWLTAEQKHLELVRLVTDEFARAALTAADVDLVCTLNRRHDLDEARRDLDAGPARAADAGHAALLACLGDTGARSRVLEALVSPRDADVLMAQVYLRHRPIVDVNELRELAAEIGQMTDATAQARALETLAQHALSDRATLEELARLFPVARSIDVQRAIAQVLLRSDYAQIEGVELVRTLREYRLRSPTGRDVIDVLITRLQVPS
jgi:hypothetical protein